MLSNTAPEVVLDRDDGGRLWIFEDTPRLSTYVVVVNAGPFHELREQRGDHSLGLYCRQSLRPYLERDAEELFRVTEQGLAFFGERFAHAVPAGALRPGLRARHGRRDGELGLRHLDRLRAATAARPTHAQRASTGARCCCTRWRTCGSATW